MQNADTQGETRHPGVISGADETPLGAISGTNQTPPSAISGMDETPADVVPRTDDLRHLGRGVSSAYAQMRHPEGVVS